LVLITLPTVRKLVTKASRTDNGQQDFDQVDSRRPGRQALPRFVGGSDKDSVGAGPATGIFGTQRGSSRNGRKW